MMAGARDRPSGGAWTTPGAASTAAARLGDAAHQQHQQQPHRPAAAAAAATTAPAGLLIVDMPHLRQGLERYFPQLVAPQGGGGAGSDGGALPLDPDADESLAVLLPSIVASLEAAYGTRFTKRVLHDSSPTGKASAVAEQLARLGGFKVRAHQQKATEAVVVDPDTLEPRRHDDDEEEGAKRAERGPLTKEKSWTLQDSSANVGMTLDVIKYAAAAKVVVVVSARPELAETLQHLLLEGEEEDAEPTTAANSSSSSSHGSQSSSCRSPPPPAVFVCALGRDVAGTPLERWLKPQPQKHQQPLTLERVLASAAEALWTRGRRNHRSAGICPKGTACGHLRGTTAEAGAGGAGSPRPFTAHKLTHLCEYLHPCGQGNGCAAAGPLHRLAFIHGGGGGSGSGNRPTSNSNTGVSSGACGRPPQLPLLPPAAAGRAQQLATSATLHNRLPPHPHYRPAYQQAVPTQPPQPQQQQQQQQQQQPPPASGRSPPLDVPAPRPLKPTGSGSLLRELTMESGGGGCQAEEELCMSPLSKAALRSSLWWYEAHRQQQQLGQQQKAQEPEGEEQEWGDEDVLGREHGAIFPMSL